MFVNILEWDTDPLEHDHPLEEVVEAGGDDGAAVHAGAEHRQHCGRHIISTAPLSNKHGQGGPRDDAPLNILERLKHIHLKTQIGRYFVEYLLSYIDSREACCGDTYTNR